MPETKVTNASTALRMGYELSPEKTEKARAEKTIGDEGEVYVTAKGFCGDSTTVFEKGFKPVERMDDAMKIVEYLTENGFRFDMNAYQTGDQTGPLRFRVLLEDKDSGYYRAQIECPQKDAAKAICWTFEEISRQMDDNPPDF